MATELLEEYGNSISGLELIPSGGGVYEVMKNGTLIFSKICLLYTSPSPRDRG